MYPIPYESFLRVGQYLANCENIRGLRKPSFKTKSKSILANTTIRKIIRSYRYKDNLHLTQNESRQSKWKTDKI